MADRRISEHTANASLADGDLFEHVDISDTTDAASGTNKKVTAANVWAYVLAKLLANDGAGSGIDADLLDGNSSAHYLAASSYTAADVLTKLLTVDGTGSLLDADLLDGNEASAFVLKSLFDANTILAATSDNTPAALTVAEQTLVGRITSGNITALTASEVRTLLGLVIGTNVQAWDADLDTLATAFARATASGPATLALHEDTDNGTNKVTITAPASTADVTFTLPAVTGTAVIAATDGPDNGGLSLGNVGAIESNVNTVASSGSTETLDTSLYAVHDVTMSESCTFTFSNPAASGICSTFVMILRGAFTPTFPASVDWGDAAAPTYTTPSVFTFTTVDGGTIWLGARVGKAFG